MSKEDTPIIGCLALQGAVQLHRPHVEAAGAEFRPVKTPKDFEAVDGFILPGGESTTMLKLIERFGLWDVLSEQFKAKPVWGICAGSILMAEHVHYSAERVEDQNGDVQKSFGLLPMTVERNAYGRQVDSHQAEIHGAPVSFIRAPVIKAIANDVTILAEHQGDPVWVQKGNKVASTFHAELAFDAPSPMHKHFVEMLKEANRQS